MCFPNREENVEALEATMCSERENHITKFFSVENNFVM